jgi:proline dehydrogenase
MPTLTNPLRPVLLAAARSERIERTVSRSRLTRSLVTRFVPGAAEDKVMEAVTSLLASGRSISVDYLGEDISHAAEAEKTVNAYLSLLAAYRRLELPPTDGARRLEVSIKLSALGQSLPDGE